MYSKGVGQKITVKYRHILLCSVICVQRKHKLTFSFLGQLLGPCKHFNLISLRTDHNSSALWVDGQELSGDDAPAAALPERFLVDLLKHVL